MKISFRIKVLFLGIWVSLAVAPAFGVDSLYIALADSIDIIVDAAGSGDFLTVQEAIDAVPDANDQRKIIYIRNGIYFEKIYIPSTKPFITLIGESVDSTILNYDDYSGRIVDGITLGTSDTYSFGLDADDFLALNLTFSNSAGDVGQAVAVRTRGDRQAFLHCKMLGYQDTYYTWGYDRNYLKDCFIEGAIDFIFGRTTTVFDSCQIHSVRENSYITAAATEQDVAFGYVFFHCKLTARYGKVGVYLGRPWKPYARTVFYECEEGDFLDAAGWSIWSGTSNHTTCYYAEYNCFGEGSDTLNRASWSHQLTEEQAAEYTLANIFSVATNPAQFEADWLPDFDSDFYYQKVKQYTTRFMDPVNYNTRLSSILVGGEEIEFFDPDSLKYVVELPPGTTDIPELEGVLSDTLATLTIQAPASLPGMSKFLVIARDGATHASYEVFLSVDSAYTNAKLKTLTVDYEDVPGFQPDIYEYNVPLPFGTTTIPKIRAYTEVSGAMRFITQAETLPGSGSVQVIALDEETENTYTIHFSLEPSASAEYYVEEGILIANPFSDRIFIRLPESGSGSFLFELYTLSGEQIFAEYRPADVASGGQIELSASHLQQGVYIYRVLLNGRNYSGRLLKQP